MVDGSWNDPYMGKSHHFGRCDAMRKSTLGPRGFSEKEMVLSCQEEVIEVWRLTYFII